jgi:hypothetical protein
MAAKLGTAFLFPPDPDHPDLDLVPNPSLGLSAAGS